MSLHRRDARRDANEAPIVEALRAAGASVLFLAIKGAGDLLVGYEGRNVLMETKLPKGPRGGSRGGGSTRPGQGGDGTLTKAQIDFRAAWQGAPPVIVRTPAEALRAIGVVT